LRQFDGRDGRLASFKGYSRDEHRGEDAMRLRGLAPPLRYAAYVAVVLVVSFVVVGVGAAAALVVGWQSGRGATGSGGPMGPGMTEGTASETSDEAQVSEGTAIETTNEAEDSGAGGVSYVHRATDGNSRGDYTYLGDPRINGDPNAVVLVAPAPGRGERADSSAYGHNVGVWYEPGKKEWAIFNQDLEPVPDGSAFEVVLPPTSESFVHRAALLNIVGNATYLDNPLTDGEPEAEVSVTQNWNPGGGNGVYNDHPMGVLYDEDVDKWFVYNEDEARMPEGAAFNVAVSGAAR
jgi:hypothetical protein